MKLKNLILVLLAGVAYETYAQDSNNEDSLMVLEELVVTARKKEETTVSVPISITAFSADNIDKANITDIRDVTALTPGLNYNAAASIGGGGRVNPNTTFRSMQNGAPVPQEQVGSTFIDGIFVTGGPQAVNTADIERIEVLKGPQSVFFGRNTFAGAINYITKTPGDEYEGEIKADSATYNSNRISIAHEGPLIADKLYYRISGASYNKGAMYQSSTDGGDLGKESTQQGSLTLFATPTEQTSIKLRLSYQKDDDSSAAIVILNGNQASCNGFTFNTEDGPVATPAGLSYFCGQTVPSLDDLGSGVLSSNTSLDNIYIPTSQTLREVLVDNALEDPFIGGEYPSLDHFGLKREAYRISVQLSHEFDNQMSLEGSVAYNDSVAAVIIDIDSTGSPDAFGYVPIKFEDTSAEIRMRSAHDNVLRWLVGANFYDGEICCEFTGSTRNIYGVGFGPGSNGRQSELDTIGFFGSVEYDFSDSLTLTAEGRYQEDTNKAVAANTEVTSYDFIPRFILNWSPQEDMNLYASYSLGVLPGQVNGNFISRPDYQQQQIESQVGDVSDIVDSDELDNYEIGIKQKFLEGRAFYTVTVYYAQWSNKKVSQNIQASKTPGGPLVPANSVFIEGEQELYGMELEGSMLLGDNWQLHAAVAYNKSEYDKFFNGGLQRAFNTQNYNGKSEPQNPEWSGNIDITYSDRLSDEWDWHSRWDAIYKGKTYLSSANIAELDDFVTVNGHLGFDRDNLSIELYVKNVFDQKNWVSGGNIVQIGGLENGLGDVGSGRFQSALVQAPDRRQLGIKTSFKF